MKQNHTKRPSKHNRKNQSLGPKFRISVPNFQFEQADNEEKVVDGIIDAHRQNKLDIKELGQKLRDSEKLPLIQQKKIFQKPRYYDIGGNTGLNKMKQDHNQKSQFDVDKLTKQACHIFGQKQPQKNIRNTRNLQSAVVRQSVGGTDASIYDKLNQSKDSNQFNASLQSQRRSKRGISEHQEGSMRYYTNNNDLTYLGSSKDLNYSKEWKNGSMKLPDLGGSLRHVNKYKQSQFQSNTMVLQQSLQQSPENKKTRPRMKKSEHQSQQGTNNLSREKSDYLESNFEDRGHNCQKTLKKYDLYTEERTPKEWLEFYKGKKGPHGICPLYINKQYIWTEADLLGFDEKSQKYKVRLYKDNSVKHVVRLSLMFNDEDRNKFMSRVGNAKVLQLTAEDEVKFQKYVESLPAIIASPMSESQKIAIENKLYTVKKHRSESQLNNKQLMHELLQQEQSSFTQYAEEKRLLTLFDQVHSEYLLFQKKAKILEEMKDPENEQKWTDLHVKNRYIESQIPYFGTIEQLEYNFDGFQQDLKRISLRMITPQVIKCLNIIQNRAYTIQEFKLFNTKYRQQDLPMELADYHKDQKKYHNFAVKQIDIQWREFVINEVQDRLREVFNFYIFKMEEYANTDLQKMLRLIDFMVNQFLRQTYIKKNIEMYCEFLKNFTRPDENVEHLQGLWPISNFPLLYLDLVVDKDFKKKHDQQKKEQKKFEQQLKLEKQISQKKALLLQKEQQEKEQSKDKLKKEGKSEENPSEKPQKTEETENNNNESVQKTNHEGSQQEKNSNNNNNESQQENNSQQQSIQQQQQQSVQQEGNNLDEPQQQQEEKKPEGEENIKQSQEKQQQQNSIPQQVENSPNNHNNEEQVQQFLSEPIYFSPTLEEIEKVLLEPMELLVKSNNSVLYLEKDLVPLINTKKTEKKSYEIDIDNSEIQLGLQKIKAYLKQGFQEPIEILQKFKKFSFLFEKSVNSVLRSLFPQDNHKELPKIMDLDPQKSMDKLQQFVDAKRQIQMYTCIDKKTSQLFTIRTQQAKQILSTKCQEFITALLLKIQDICGYNCERISKTFRDIEDKLTLKPKDEKQLVELQIALQENEINLSKLNMEVLAVVEFLDILEHYNHAFDKEKSQIFWYLKSRPSEILALVGDAKNVAGKSEDKFMERLEQEKTNFNMEIREIQTELILVKQFHDYKNVKQNATVVMQLMERIGKANDTIRNFNERENIFKQIPSEYPDLEKVQKEFEPYHHLWETAIEFDMDQEGWKNGSFLENKYIQIEKKIQNYYKEASNLIKLFNNQLEDFDAGDVGKALKKDVENFKEHMWIIELLTTESLLNVKKSQHHWKEIFERCGIKDIVVNEEMSLTNLLAAGISEHREILEDVSNKAEKQWAIEKKLREMEEKTKEQKVELMMFKNTGSYVLKALDDVQQLLDDQLNVLVMMKASPYIKPLLKQAQTYEGRIILIIDTIDECLKCQRSWMYLEPIFSSDDIIKKLPFEKRQFDKVDQYWREIMMQFEKDQSVWENIDNEKMKQDFKSHNRTLEAVQKSLSEYLETKRRYFPRFYFLSDEELLEILADTKDPLKVQKHINKCFEAINALDFNHEQHVQGMISAEKEKVQFKKKIDVTEGERKGNVEIWLLEIEELMQKTLQDMTQECMADTQDRNDWLQSWPGQLILAVDMMRWTNSAEVAIKNGKDKSTDAVDWNGQAFKDLTQYRQHLESQLQDVVQLVRTDLPDLARLTLGALVTLDVHAKDVIVELEDRKCRDRNDFQWISQLRYEWEDRKKREKYLWVKMINATIKYGFEYLGNSPRLVITPLTDRCYRTLMGAKHLQYGGAPEGPAGTGKTETVKDLAKALAVQCVVFNCSDGLNYLAMRKFFKGLASSGAWCCFDEFNRIDLEVLSVIAQQVLTIQEAIKEHKKVFYFDDEEIPIIPSCAVNITMNPGYAGRSELPDNLKALFRPCAMMVPDYALISEIYLYSVGFTDARNLARKVVASLRLSSEQLSSQDHYDFGMRAVKAILTAAGNLKRVMLDEVEDIVCLRALMDVNLPKFTINDVPLFVSITSDLFPGVVVPEKDYGLLKDSLISTSEKLNLVPMDNFLTKCIQLYDTINVRHGLMVVGTAFSGKSCVVKTLQQAITALKGQQNFQSVQVRSLNPKGVTSDQLFGRLDPDTKSWSDGVVAIIMRECAQAVKNPENKWIMFDGPVDAVWIENMNTVLDDNKKLCLTSGEIIKMTPQMRMMFEVEDLAVASPATVSRCGMVFLETKTLTFDILVQSFINKLPELIEPYRQKAAEVLKHVCDVSIAWCQKNANLPVHRNFNAIVQTVLKYFENFIKIYRDEECQVKFNRDIQDDLDNQLLFSIIWGFGGAMDEQSRNEYDLFIRKVISGEAEITELYGLELYLQFEYQPQTLKPKITDKHSIFLQTYEPEIKKWLDWTATEDKYQIPDGGEFHEIFVPTSDSIRNKYFIHLSVQNQIHTLFCGPTGTGKTVNIQKEINENYMNQEYTNLCTAFSGQTSVNQTQKIIESKVSSRRRKGVFGPEEGKKYIVIFIDDLNMPQKETYGAQPPIELLRQWMDSKSMFDLETREIKYLVDITFLTAMLPSGNQLTLRFLRHFNVMYNAQFESQSLVRIFSHVLEWYFHIQADPVPNVIRTLKDTIVNSTIELYQQIQKSEALLPTPAKSHYLYNLRDISKVFQGISKSTYQSYRDEDEFIRLWVHECQRVFQDRLISKDDQKVFEIMLQDILVKRFQKHYNTLLPVIPTLWASFVPTLYPQGDTSKPKLEDVYCEIQDHKELQKKTYEYLAEFNQFYSANRMNLVLFMDAIQHVIKIVRVITTPYGHCLLVGVGGSGRKSLATLSSFISTLSEPQIIDENNWVEEIQRVVKQAGLEEKPVVFLFSDTQILKETNVEEICNILNNGEIPNLFPVEEKAKIIEDITITGTATEKYNYFLQQCKKNLHMVLAFSPVGEQFRRRLRTFPTLVNCTTIDWFLPWPEEALRNTAQSHFVQEMEIDSKELRDGLEEIAVDMQTRVSNLTIRYREELRRFYYVTPTSYLELLSIFKKLVQEREKILENQIIRYETGIKKIVETEGVIEIMQKELEELQPLLKEKTEKNQVLLKELQIQQKQADGEREICEIDEEKCNVQRDEANSIREECQIELDKVIPLLDEAAKALEKITKDDMNILRTFVKPPEPAVLVMEGVTYAFNEDQNVKTVPKKDSKTNEKVKDFWEYAKKKLLNDKLMKRVMEFKEDQIRKIPQVKVTKLKKFMEHPLLEKDKVFNASKAAGNLMLWLRAVVNTHHALLVVDPKKQELSEAEQKLQSAEAELNEKKAALQKILGELAKLQENFDQAQQEKQELQQKVDTCQLQLDRADKLINGLASEKVSWGVKAQNFKEEQKTVIGDCLLSSGMIAYMGAFPIAYREETMKIWKELLETHNILFSKNYSLQNVLSDAIEIGQWTQAQKLPNDSFSIDNAIILKNSQRYPLMIDPQQQANIWVKKLESNRNLNILKPSQNPKELALKMENCIQLGFPVLLENVGETIDNIFESVLQKKIVKVGGALKIKFGEKLLDYSKDFMLYMTTKLPKPHYPPEICVKVTLLNFQTTVEGLEDQMLNIVVQNEEPLKDKQRQQNIEEYFNYKDQQKKTEILILKLLNESEGNLLDDDQLIQTLETSKVESKEIEDALQKQEHFQHVFNNIREFYRSVAVNASNLYFVILDMGLVEPTYQWSLDFYINLFLRAMQKAPAGKQERCKNIIAQFQIMLYESICRSLLEKDKQIFSFLLCNKLLEVADRITQKEIRFIMVGGTMTEPTEPQPEGTQKWLSNKQWCALLEMETTLPDNYTGFIADFKKNIKAWEELIEDSDNYINKWPGEKWNDLEYFHKLTIVRILFTDKFGKAVNKLITIELGEEFIQPPQFNLKLSTEDATPFTPLVFVLSSGADPRLEILNLAAEMGKADTLQQISLGQGQGEIAEKAIIEAVADGSWVLLQNCHLAPSFMPELERILENMQDTPENVNDEFRIWLTTMPSEVFPSSILMKSIKMTFEPPRGLRNNLQRSFQGIDKKFYESSVKPKAWKKLFFGLAFFHALIIERRKFGPLGWNIPYEFTIADFNISYHQLKMFMDEYEEIPWEALNYMVAEANYGGRVTDTQDRRLIKIILADFYDQKILDNEYKFSESGNYYAPPPGLLDDTREFIQGLPLFETTEVFGLHSNAAITSAIIETNHICDTILGLLPRETGGKGQKPEDIILAKINVLLEKLPPLFDTERAKKLHPVRYLESMNTVLQQELIRFNKLLKTVVNSLKDLAKAIKGLLVMSSDLEKLFNSIFDNKIPDLWAKVSYPSLKPMGSYLNDLIERLAYMQNWIDEGAPANFWISGFYFTQSFLTGVLQNFARKYKDPIDTLTYQFEVISDSTNRDVHVSPDDGCYIHGLFLEGCKWDTENGTLGESDPKQLYCKMPYIYLLPTKEKLDYEKDRSVYQCPVYKTTLRKGVLSTTGHSTNYVLSMYLKISENETPEHWVKRGVAAITQLDD